MKLLRLRKAYSLGAMLLLALALILPVGCSQDDGAFKTGKTIQVVSREDGSGTRGAFVELFGVLEKGNDGTKIDRTYSEAIIASKTDVVMTTVQQDMYSIGYISLGSLNDTVKSVKIDGVEPTTDNVLAGTYTIARPFHIATKGEQSELVADFISYMLSKEGQAIVADKYIPVDTAAGAYRAIDLSGKIVVGGSTSVTPVMEKLAEAYEALNPKVNIEIQSTGSSAGMSGAIDGILDIGMASRNLKESELAELDPVVISMDGIALIVNNGNPTDNLTKAEVKAIFVGDQTKW